MATYLRNSLIYVWALLTAVTVVSWLTARDGGGTHHLNASVTVVVLLIAAVKTQLVIWYFMEVQRAPTWLKATTTAWLIALFGFLLGLYFAAQ
ncbi:cytochrome C oxidase subunit IV family protein [Mycobacterium sp. 1274761.0]|uniref:cytochrome C oxidase subunit IV family protein n=1 Tax=Mycobacterium sp. 1274761.0 TaxID=1834077 RepID=UPI0007FE892C|nr:cytochrome C oxidase subunit IV family protein [Mycobacterium sp. 1274761.0]OBK70269.1 hypothetical protein A5651_22940 [Mycobacterium sp. 1274761.0]